MASLAQQEHVEITSISKESILEETTVLWQPRPDSKIQVGAGH